MQTTRRLPVVAALALVAGLGGGALAGAGTSQVFSDVSPNHPFHEEIERFAGAGISTGYPDGTFRPGAPVTRQAMAAFLGRGLGSVATDYENYSGPFGNNDGRVLLNQRTWVLPWAIEARQMVVVRAIVDWTIDRTRLAACPAPGPSCGFQLVIRQGNADRATSNARIEADFAGGTTIVEAVYEVGGGGFRPELYLTPSSGVEPGSINVLQSAITVQTFPFALQGAPTPPPS